MWPFSAREKAPNESKRLLQLEEQVESLARRMSALIEDVDEYYRKINKARQRVVKEEADGAANGSGSVAGRGEGRGVGVVPLSREALKAQLRQKARGA